VLQAWGRVFRVAQVAFVMQDTFMTITVSGCTRLLKTNVFIILDRNY
jgi:hypothetical protein